MTFRPTRLFNVKSCCLVLRCSGVRVFELKLSLLSNCQIVFIVSCYGVTVLECYGPLLRSLRNLCVLCEKLNEPAGVFDGTRIKRISAD